MTDRPPLLDIVETIAALDDEHDEERLAELPEDEQITERRRLRLEHARQAGLWPPPATTG